ncbi:hypothetical protein AJ79_02941 [Helicocarpus griseus UAMH5409]|uniref:ABM domain-containing protein n=1 Tax=Helicocarpus griseus UAMH5409 TaxID=1447875 RepID=A0A2B7XZG1_9EURO|nr:hypothetical protein AJ79_02941 [Helicocarpus griseus UAMH5409]
MSTTSTAAEMKAYEQMLLQHKPALNIPVTEVVIFKLLENPTAETTEVKQDFVANAGGGEGMRRTAWGYSLDDPRTVVMMFEWRKIQDHWAFWQTPAFEPVIKCIRTIFEPERPLVRHYKFDPPGMLEAEYIKVMVWDEGAEKSREEMEAKVKSDSQSCIGQRGGFAVDMNEMTWYCTLLGYPSEQAARSDGIEAQGEAHLVKFEYTPRKE